MRQLGTYLSTLPANLFNQLALELFRVDHPTAAISSLEAILHPLLKTLEVNSKSLGLVLDYAYSLTNVTTLYLFFDISRYIFPCH